MRRRFLCSGIFATFILTLACTGSGTSGSPSTPNRPTALSDSATATAEADRAPTAEEVAAILSAPADIPDDWLTYEDSFYGWRLRYPPTWQVTYGEVAPEPHGITLRHPRSEPVGLPKDVAPEEYVGDAASFESAFVGIQPFLAEPVSDARCPQPAQGTLAGHPIRVCVYNQLDGPQVFPNISLMFELYVVSVTVVLDEGPVYISAAVEE